MTGLHRVYLEVSILNPEWYFNPFINLSFDLIQPEGPIYQSLIQFVRNPNDMSVLFDRENEIYKDCAEVACRFLEEICEKLTEFMVKLLC